MQAPYPVPAPPKKSNTALIVLLIVGGVILLVIAVIGVLAVLAISGTRKYVAAAKTAEATNTVGEIARNATAAYEREALDPSGAIAHKLCGSASRPVPASMSDVRGKKYMSTSADWSADSAKNAGFYCLKFQMDAPQYYQYDYKVTGSGSKTGDAFTATARGDLDGDGQESTFTITGTVGAGDMVTAGALKQTDPEE